MATNRVSAIRRMATWSLLGTTLAGCGTGGSGPSGVYVAKHPDSPVVFFEKFDFQSGGNVAVTAFGDTSIGKYVVMEGGRVEITMAEGQMAHLKDAGDNCLVAVSDAGMVLEAAKDGLDLDEMGRFCRR